METRKEKAAASFNSGFNCAQSVFSTYADLFGLDTQSAYRIAGGFGGGMGRLQEVCGAVTGAMMVVGLKHGKVRPDDNEAHETTYMLTREVARRFREKHGTISCRDLLGCDLLTPEGHELFKTKNLKSLVCEKCVRDAASIVEELLYL